MNRKDRNGPSELYVAMALTWLLVMIVIAIIARPRNVLRDAKVFQWPRCDCTVTDASSLIRDSHLFDIYLSLSRAGLHTSAPSSFASEAHKHSAHTPFAGQREAASRSKGLTPSTLAPSQPVASEAALKPGFISVNLPTGSSGSKTSGLRPRPTGPPAWTTQYG